MDERIPLARPSITDAERSALLRVLDGHMLTGGARLGEFEAAVAKRSERSHAVAVSSGTAALELGLWAMGVKAGDPVLVTAFGFPAGANAVTRLGARPLAVDVCPGRWSTDFEVARRMASATPDAKVLISIDPFGLCCESDEIRSFTEDTGVAVLSDSACAIGASDASGRAGGHAGRLATFSFHPRKVVTTGEGGALVCDDEEIRDRLRELRNHGQGQGRFQRVGTNARLGECAAAMGCAQLARLDAMLGERRLLADGYEQRLEALVRAGLVELQQVPEGALPARQSFCVNLAGKARGRRAELIAHLDAEGIQAGVGTFSFCELELHRGAGEAPVSRNLHENCVSLPLYVGMRSAQLDRVCDALAEGLR